MATKDIPDWVLCEAADSSHYGLNFVIEHTGQPFKVCMRALERGYKRNLITCGSVGGAILLEKGEDLLAEHRKAQTEDDCLAIVATIQRLENHAAGRRSWQPENLDDAAAILRGVNEALDRLLASDDGATP